MSKKEQAMMLDKLQQERARLHRQIEALQNEVRGLDRAIALCSTTDSKVVRERPKNVKGTVVSIVKDAGVIGMTVDEVVMAARQRGIHLEKPTVASTLSRLKLDGQLAVKDGRYAYRAPELPPEGWGSGTTVN